MIFEPGEAIAAVLLALWLGVLCNGEGLAMSLILPKWHRDVKHLGVALRIAEGERPAAT